MSQLVITEAGRLRLIQTMLQTDGAGTLSLAIFLFNNDVEITRATLLVDVVAANTEEEYTVLEPDKWLSPTIVANNASITYDDEPITFTGTGSPQMIYGYAVYDTVAEALYWAEKIDTPFDLVSTQEVKVVPKFVLGSIYDPDPA